MEKISKSKDNIFQEPLWNIDEFKFNIFFGFASFFIIPFLNNSIPLGEPSWWVATIGLIIYLGEAWATFYKINVVRARIIWKKSNTNFSDLNVTTRTPGNLIWFGFIMRLCLRFSIILLVLFAFGVDMNQNDPSLFIIVILCLIVLFELFVMGFTMFESRAFGTTSKEEDEKDKTKDREEEQKWRTKMLKWKSDINFNKKEQLADIIIFVTATIGTNLFWNPMNSSFIDFINDSFINGNPVISILFFVIAGYVVSLFFIVPLKIAYWTENAMKIENKKSKIKYLLSYLFAIIGVLQPTIFYIIKHAFD